MDPGSAPIPPTPPVVPGQVPVLTVWPKVVGIFSIVIGGYGVLANCCGVITTSMTSTFMKFIPQPTTTTTTTAEDGTTTTTTTAEPSMAAMTAVIAKWQWWLVAVAALQVIAAGVLLAAGIMLVQRKRSGVGLHLNYVAVRAFTVAVYAAVNYFYMRDYLASMTQQAGTRGGPPAAIMSGFIQSLGVVGVVIAVVWGLLYPGFLFVWFRTESVRRETASWK